MLSRPGFRKLAQDATVADARRRLVDEYRAYEAELTSAWKKDADEIMTTKARVVLASAAMRCQAVATLRTAAKLHTRPMTKASPSSGAVRRHNHPANIRIIRRHRMSKLSLEKRIADALNNNIAAIDLAALITETEAAITQAATAERREAFDPTLSPDPTAARAAMDEAEFMCNRLQTMLPRLEAKLVEVEAQEYLARWKADRDHVEKLKDAAAQRFTKYPELVAKLVDLFREAEQVDKDVSRVNAAAPAGPHRHLKGVELTARGIEKLQHVRSADH